MGRRPERGQALTPREQQVRDWLLRGLSRAQIASRLGVKPETVKTQQAAVYRKLGAAGRHAVAATAWNETRAHPAEPEQVV